MSNKNRSGALNAMCSTRRETKDIRETERATRDETETLRTGSPASSARRSGNGTCGKASEKRATTKRDGGKERAGEPMLADRSKSQPNKLAVTPEQT